MAFTECSSLKEIVLPSTLTEIGYGAFTYCSALENVVLPDSLVKLGSGAFRDCASLKSVTIPASVKSISADIFSLSPAGFVIRGTAGSAAEDFAKANGYTFEAI